MSQDMKNRIRERVRELGVSARRLSLEVSDNADLIRMVTRPDGAENPRGDTLSLLAQALKVSEEWLLHGDESGRNGHAGGYGGGALVAARKPRTNAGKRSRASDEGERRRPELPDFQAYMIPVLGTAAGSVLSNQLEGFALGDPVDHVEAPPALRTAKDAYALYVEGNSMADRHSHGDLRFVHPHRVVAPGDTVVVVTQHYDEDPGQAYIKILVERTPDHVTLQQLRPPATIRIPTRYVAAIHRVLNTNELFGR